MGAVLGELAALGYDAEWESIPAAAFGAPHLRYRVFIVGYPQRCGCSPQGVKSAGSILGAGTKTPASAGIQSHVADAERNECRRKCGELGSPEIAESIGGNKSTTKSRGRGKAPSNVAYAECKRLLVLRGRKGKDIKLNSTGDTGGKGAVSSGSSSLADAERKGWRNGERSNNKQRQDYIFSRTGERRGGNALNEANYIAGKCGQWSVEPDVGRVADGVPARVDRLRTLGNAVVPQVAEWVGRRIIEFDNVGA